MNFCLCVLRHESYKPIIGARRAPDYLKYTFLGLREAQKKARTCDLRRTRDGRLRERRKGGAPAPEAATEGPSR